MTNLARSLVLLALPFGFTHAQSFTDLGPGDFASISADGQVAVFEGAQGIERWTASGGSQSLGRLRPAGCSADGSIIWGEEWTFGSPGPFKPQVWKDGIGWTGAFDSWFWGRALDVASDGNAIVWSTCACQGVNPGSEVYNTQEVDQFILGPTQAVQMGRVFSGDGLRVGGERFLSFFPTPSGYQQAVVWTDPFTFDRPLIGTVQPDGEGVVLCLNHEGSMGMVRAHTGPAAGQTYLWRDTGTVELLEGQSGHTWMELISMSADGSLAVGGSQMEEPALFPGSGDYIHALAWTPEDGVLDGALYLDSRDTQVPAGLELKRFTELSADGNELVGYADDTAGTRHVFHATLPPWTMYRRDSSPVNSLTLRGGGSASLGGTMQPTTSNVVGPITFTVSATRSGAAPLWGGDLHVGPFLSHIQLNVAAGGTSTGSYFIPTDTGLAGVTFYLQSASRDASQPAGWSLSNGLKVTVQG